MPSIQGKFADQNDLIVTGQVISANNNQIGLNAALAETNQIRSSAVIFQPNGLVATIGSPVPDVAAATSGTIGAALGGVGQEGTASQEPGGGGIPCFDYFTKILMADGTEKNIGEVAVGKDVVKSFDKMGNVIDCRVIGKWEHAVGEYYQVEFEDGRVTNTTQEHRYWVSDDLFVPISVLDKVQHWNVEWSEVAIKAKEIIIRPVFLYNLTIDLFQTYFANGDAVHNVKPAQGNES